MKQYDRGLAYELAERWIDNPSTSVLDELARHDPRLRAVYTAEIVVLLIRLIGDSDTMTFLRRVRQHGL